MVGNEKKAGGRPMNRVRVTLWSLAGCVMLLPLVAMRFTSDVKWTAGDFLFAGLLLGGTGLAFELVVRRSASRVYRVASGIALAAAFLLVWINGAVGIIGSETNRANLMYAGVLAIAVLGALLARFRPLGMARALLAAAAAQVLVAGIALAGGLGSDGPLWPRDLLGLTGIFVVLFVASALLFQKAAREPQPVAAQTL